MTKHLGVATLIATLALGFAPDTVGAKGPLDLSTPDGHFYTQTNGTSPTIQTMGFEISNAEGIPFWSFYTALGGVDVLGYPVSQRFTWDGFVCQATQRAVLQWDPTTHRVQIANIMDYFASTGKTDWLMAAHLAPNASSLPDPPHASLYQIEATRSHLLDSDPVIKAFYLSTPNRLELFGLPTSAPVNLGPYDAVRFQRTVIYHWWQPVKWANAQGVSVALAGDWFKEGGFIPSQDVRPTKVGVAAIRQVSHTLKDVAGDPYVTHGIATWYGADFQGQPMSNGEIYNMYNASTAACNIYPLGSWLRITRLATGKSILVRVTDHGAFRYPILVDLSYAAFSRLGSPRVGILGISVERIE